jgi:hypothetical protein
MLVEYIEVRMGDETTMATNYDPNVLFYEEQQFRQPWLMVLLIVGFLGTLAAALMAGVAFYRSHPSGQAFANPGIYVLAVEALLVGLITALFLSVKMITEVRLDGLAVRAHPIARLRRFIPYNQIDSCEPRTYSPIGEYGGWGIRYGRGGRAYNVSGNRGVQLVLKSGERLLIGSQKSDELASAILERMAV